MNNPPLLFIKGYLSFSINAEVKDFEYTVFNYSDKIIKDVTSCDELNNFMCDVANDIVKMWVDGNVIKVKNLEHRKKIFDGIYELLNTNLYTSFIENSSNYECTYLFSIKIYICYDDSINMDSEVDLDIKSNDKDKKLSFDFQKETKHNQEESPKITEGKEYKTCFYLLENKETSRENIFRCKIDGEKDVVMKILINEDIGNFVEKVKRKYIRHYVKNNDFEYYNFSNYKTLYDTIRNILYEQIRIYYKEVKENKEIYKYKIEINFRTEKEGITITSKNIQSLS